MMQMLAISFRDLLAFESESFHFLRPQWLWLYLVLSVLVIFLFFSNREKTKWKKVVAAPLRKYMFSTSSKRAILYPLIVFFLVLSLGIFALAGPAWKRIEVPGMKSTAVLMVLLDLSWSMMAEDIQPNRLERAKLKIRDLLDANPGSRVSLFVYAGTTHPVLPLTSDYKLIQHHVDHLKANMMPIRGDNLDLAMQMADTLLGRITAPSTLLLITDEVEASETNTLLSFVANSPHAIEVLVMSTPNGAPVPGFRRNTLLRNTSGSVIQSQADQAVWNQLDQNPRIRVNRLTLDKSDVEGIAERVRKDLVFQLEDESSEEEWQDEGLLFLVPAVFFAIFFFRKGFIIQWCWVVGLVLSSCAPDHPYADWWYASDYKGQLYQNEMNYEAAADAYEDTQRKAVAYFKSGDYEAAAALFAMDSSSTGYYNYGLALAANGNLREAEAAFKEALKQDPELTAANEGLVQVEQALLLVDSISRFEAKQAVPETEQGPLIERQAQSEDEELTSDTEVEELPEEGDRVTDEVQSNMIQAEELERPPEDMEAGRQESAQNILLRTISAEPTEFLRRRFRFQKDKYYPDVKEGDKKW